MRYLVAEGAKLRCTMGSNESFLKLTPRQHMVDGQAIANVDDRKALIDIESFGLCQSPSNPQVQAATAAAQGVLTPMPCQPPTFTQWTPGASSIFQNQGDGSMIAALTSDSRCVCGYAGVVTIEDPNTHLNLSDAGPKETDDASSTSKTGDAVSSDKTGGASSTSKTGDAVSSDKTGGASSTSKTGDAVSSDKTSGASSTSKTGDAVSSDKTE